MYPFIYKCCTPHCMIRSLTYWNYITDSTQYISREIYGFFSYILGYFSKDKWFILPGHTYPIAANSVVNDYDPYFRTNIWKYDANKNRLEYHHTPLREPVKSYKLSWLSAKINNVGSYAVDYELDNFISTMCIYTDNVMPRMQMLLTAWSIKNKIWFSQFSVTTIHIIDEFGEDRYIYLDKDEVLTDLTPL